jgi:hypothetical protein
MNDLIEDEEWLRQLKQPRLARAELAYDRQVNSRGSLGWYPHFPWRRGRAKASKA